MGLSVSDKLAFIREYKKQGGKGNYLSAIKQYEFGGEKKPTFEEYYKTIPQEKNDTSSYSLREAYKELPYSQMKEFAENPKAHLGDTYKLPNHPTFSNESKYSNEKTPGGEWVQLGNKWYFQHSNFTNKHYNKTAEYLNGSGEEPMLPPTIITPKRNPIGPQQYADGGEVTQSIPYQAPTNQQVWQSTIPKQPIVQKPVKLSPKEFTEKYIDSDIYLDRLIKSDYDTPLKIVEKRLESVKNTKPIKYNEPTSFIQKVKDSWNGVESNNSRADVNGNIIINKEQIKDAGATIPNVETHEYGHRELFGYGLNSNDYEQLKKRVTNPNASYHDLSPSENKSDLNAVRYELYNHGIDVLQKNITLPQIQKLKKYTKDAAIKRLFKNYNDKDALWLLNNIAQNQSKEEQNLIV